LVEGERKCGVEAHNLCRPHNYHCIVRASIAVRRCSFSVQRPSGGTVDTRPFRADDGFNPGRSSFPEYLLNGNRRAYPPFGVTTLEVALKIRTLAGMFLFSALAGMIYGQAASAGTAPTATTDGTAVSATPKAPVKFVIADIHKSPPLRFPFFQGGILENGRYILRQATMVDLIRTAYGLKDPNDVHGGPSWLEWDRWDVIAKVPAGTNEAQANQMLKSLLKDRFNLVAHTGESEMPAYWPTVASSGAKMKATPSGTSDGACHEALPAGQQAGAVPLLILNCTNRSMADLAETLTKDRGGMYLQDPVVDKSDLKGGYDFELKYTPMWMLSRANGAGVTIFNAMRDQLGLKLELKTAPEPGLVVDGVNQMPTPNAPDLAKIMPPLPPAQFEVAVIKPSAPGEKPMFRPGGDEIVAHAIPLKVLLDFALNQNFNQKLVGAPSWVDSDKIDLEAKVATANLVQGAGKNEMPVSIDDLRNMLKALLIDRYEIKMHTEQMPKTAYTLVAVDPKMTRANPAERTLCKEGPGPDGKDPRLTQPILNMLVTCQNITMAEAGDEIPNFAAWYIHYPILDKTGLKGGWDFTLSWSSGDHMPVNAGPNAPPPQGGTGSAPQAAEPNGALSFYDAVSKELGLKLVKVKRPEPVLVFDHIDPQPTPN
jgi:uncharacterized protein (TIGR03435 family)